MLVLDETYTGALFRQGAEDGFVRHAVRQDEDALYKDQYTSELLKKGLNPLVRQDVLWDLLLFYPAICYPFDNLNVDLLIAEGLIKEPLSHSEQLRYTKIIDERPESIYLFERFILGDLKDKGYEIYKPIRY